MSCCGLHAVLETETEEAVRRQKKERQKKETEVGVALDACMQ